MKISAGIQRVALKTTQVIMACVLALGLMPGLAFAGNLYEAGGIPEDAFELTVQDGDNAAPVLVAGAAQVSRHNVAFEDAFVFNPSVYFSDPDGDEMTYLVAVDGGKPQPWDMSAGWQPTSVGSHQLRFTASDGQAVSAAAHIAKLTVTRRVPNHDITVYSMQDTAISFYACAGFEEYVDIPGELLESTGPETKEVEGVGTMSAWTVSVPFDTDFISYRGEWANGSVHAGQSLGGMTIPITNDMTEAYLAPVEFRVPGRAVGRSLAPDDVNLTIRYGSNRAVVGNAWSETGGDALRFGALLVAGVDSYSVVAAPSDSIKTSFRQGSVEGIAVAASGQARIIEVSMLDLADVKLERDMVPVFIGEEITTSLELVSPYTGTFSLAPGQELPAGLSLSKDGTLSGTPSGEPGAYTVDLLVTNEAAPAGAPVKLTIDVSDYNSYLGVKTEAKIYKDWDQDLWLNAQQVKLDVGETFKFCPRRIPFAGNDVALVSPSVVYPTYHIQKIRGDSIDMPLTLQNYEDIVIGLGSHGYRNIERKYTVTGTRPGTTIIQVVYDDIDPEYMRAKGVFETSILDRYPATPDCNIGYMVFTVGETGSAKITSSIDNWLHYNTVYFTEGDHIDYPITADVEGAREFHVTCNGLEVEPGMDGRTYTLPLENRSNIIGMVATDADGNQSSTWRIIDARKMEVSIENVTSPGEPIAPGETARISFKGLVMPVNRIMGYYNPQMNSPSFNNVPFRVRYRNDVLGGFEGICAQWDISVNNDFEVTFPEEGDYVFGEGDIFGQWWGAPLGYELGDGEGYAIDDNGDAPELGGVFCAGMLPSFTVSVNDPNAKYKRASGTAYLSVSRDGAAWTADGAQSGTTLTRLPIDLGQVSKIDLADYGLDGFDYDADGDGQYEVTLLHLLLYANQQYASAGADGIALSGSSTPGSMFFDNLFGFGSGNLNYYLNGAYPLARPGWGATADRIVVHDGDFIDVGWYTKKMAGSSFRYFTDASGAIAFDLDAVAGEACALNLASAHESREAATGTALDAAPAGWTIHWGRKYGADFELGSATTDANGRAVITFPSSGDFVVWSDGSDGTGADELFAAPAYAVVHPVSDLRADIAKATAVVNGGEPIVWAGVPAEPGIALTAADGMAIDPLAYGIEYLANDRAGTGVAIISGNKRTTKGSLTVTFPIAKRGLEDSMIAEIPDQEFSGAAVSPDVSVTADGVELKAGVDYAVSFSSNDRVGTATATVTGIGNYEGAATRTFRIVEAAKPAPDPKPEPAAPETLAATRVTLAKTSFTYTGKAITPAVTVKNAAGKTLVAGTDYTVAYSANTAAGTAKVTVAGKGSYTGTVSKSFAIAKAKNTFAAKAKAAKKAVTVKAGKALAAKKYVKVGKPAFGGKLSYKLGKAPAKLKKHLKVATKTGKITVAKKAKPGTYTVKLKITSKASPNYTDTTRTVKLKLKVK